MKKKFVMIFVMILFSLSLIGGASFLLADNLITKSSNTSENAGEGVDNAPEENGKDSNSDIEDKVDLSASTFTVTFDANGGTGTMSDMSVSLGGSFTVSSCSFLRTGYTFVGWLVTGCDSGAVEYGALSSSFMSRTSESGFSFSTTLGAMYVKNARTSAGTVTVKANWQAITYTIAFSTSEGTGSRSSITATYDQWVYIEWGSSSFSKTGYEFYSWNVAGMDTCTHYYGSSTSTYWTTNVTGRTFSFLYYKNLRSTSGTVTFYTCWSPLTYTCDIVYTQQNVTNSTGITITSSAGTVTNSTLTSTSTYATVSCSYSTSRMLISISATNSNYSYMISYDNEVNYASPNTSFYWTPTQNYSYYIYVKQVYRVTYDINGATGGEVDTIYNFFGHGGWLTIDTNDLTKDGYEANGWNTTPEYKSTPDYVGGEKYSENAAMTLYANFKPIQFSSNLLKYDEIEKYYYFEDGYMPQTYADMIASGLNTSVTNYGTKIGEFSLENGTTYMLASYDDYYYLGFTATKDMTLDLVSYETSGTYSFTQGTLYWFRFEPIRWRITDYGVTEPPEDWSYGVYRENFSVVSDLVLWYDCMATESYIEGKSSFDMTFTTSLRDGNFETMLSTFTNAYTDGELLYSGSNSAEWQKFGETGQQNPVQVDTTHTTSDYELTKINKYTSGNTSSLRVASTDEISNTIGNTKAKSSCLVAFLMGSSNTQYSKYWTRDLGNNLNAGKVVAKNGLTRSEWLTNSNGIRFAYTVSEGSNML